MARDHALCEAMVEPRRSLLTACLMANGWAL